MSSRKSFKLEQLGPGWERPGLVAGVDEAGRGPLAGPVVAAAVILDDLQPLDGLNASKVAVPLAIKVMSQAASASCERPSNSNSGTPGA